jgi:hypothetical protein
MKKIHFIILLSLISIERTSAQLNNNGANIVTTTGSYIVLQDINFANKGVFIQSAGVVRMTGIANNTITGTIKPQFYTLEIAKTGIAETQVFINLDIAKEVSFISGLLNLNNRNIYLLGTAVIKGETETRRIIGPNGGYIEVNAALNAPANANPGNLGAFITSTKNFGNTIIRRGHQSQVVGGGNSNSLLRYYDIIPANNIDLNAALRFQYLDAELNGINEGNAILFKKVNNVVWTNQGFTTRSTAANYVLKTAINDFFRWTVSAPVNVPGRPTEPVIVNSNSLNSAITKTNAANIFIENLYPTVGEMQRVYIKTGNMDIQKMKMMLFDMQGRLILNEQLSYQSQWLNLPPLLAAGIYKLVIQSGASNYQQNLMKQ